MTTWRTEWEDKVRIPVFVREANRRITGQL